MLAKIISVLIVDSKKYVKESQIGECIKKQIEL